jgi:hypothetical protein
MSEKKVVNRNIVIALGIICIILIVGLVGAIANYTLIINGKDNTISTKDSQISNLQNQNNDLQTWLEGNITLFNSERDVLKAPKLVMDLGYEDVRPYYGTPYLHIHGIVINVGTNVAYNCKLHLVAYQSSVVTIDTYIVLDIINGESWRYVNEKVYYSGSAITSYTIVPQWTTSP